MSKGMRVALVWAVAASVEWGMAWALAVPDCNESESSPAVRVDARGNFGGRLVHGVEIMGEAGGGLAQAWDTRELADGWQEVVRGTNRTTVAVANGAGVAVEYGRMGADATWGSNRVHVVRDWVAVPSGRTLEIAAGTVVKFTRGTGILVEEGGTLRLKGEWNAPVRMTAAEDDSAGGDTDMREEMSVGCYFVDIRGNVEDSGWTQCWYADMAESAGMQAAGMQVFASMLPCGESEWSAAARLDARAARAGTLLTVGDEWATWNTAWDGASRVRVELERPDGTVALLGEVEGHGLGSAEWTADAAGRYEVRYEAWDGAGKVLRRMSRGLVRLDGNAVLHSGRVGESETWAAGTVHVVNGTVTVELGSVLTIERGAVVKFAGGSALVVENGGTCVAEGVVFTHVNDDTIGGDTMGDGNETMPLNDDYGISGSIATDAATELRYLTVKTSGTLSGNTVWMGNRVIHVTGDVTVPSGATLTVMPGAVVKFDEGMSLTVNGGGTLNAIGTRAQPIVFTSVKDDEHGGDTNGDGDATVAQPGDWSSIKINGGAAHFSHASILYGSRNQTTGAINMTSSGGEVAFVNGEIAHGAYDAVGVESGHFYMTNSVIRDCLLAFRHWAKDPIVNCVIYDCGRLTQGGGQHFVNCVFSRITEAWEAFGFPQNGTTYDHCCFWNEEGSVLTGEGTQDAMTVCGKNGNLWGNPLFLDADRGDFRVVAGSPCVDAGDSSVAPERDAWEQPRMDVKAAENTGVPNVEGACADIGIYEVPGTVTGPMADVAVLSLSVPVSARVGEEVTVSYVVTNRGTAVASGTVRDAIRLRGADETTAGMSVEAVEVGQVYSLEPRTGARMTARVRIPVVAAGTWQVGVEANPARDFFESNLGNNRAWSERMMKIRLDTLEVGTHEVTVATGTTAGYELEGVPASGGWVRVSGRGAGTLAVMAGNGAMPTADGGGTAAVALPDGDLLVVLPAREEGESAYLSLANGSRVPVEAEVTVSVTSPALLAVSPSRVPNTGEAAVALYGCGLDAGIATLGGQKATALERIDGARVLATFDVDGAAACTVDVSAAGATLAGAVEIYAVKTGAKLEAWLETPGSIRDGRVFTAHVCYRNAGDVAMPLPLFKVSRQDSTTKLGMVAGEMPTETALFVGGVAPSAPAGKLKPGEEGRVAFFFQPFGSYRLSLAHIGDTEAAEAFPAFGRVAGYREAVSAAATRLALRGMVVTDLHALTAQALLERNGQPCAAISGRLLDAAARTPLADIGIAAITAAEGGAAATAVTDAEGWFSLTGLADGAYRFLLDAGTVLAVDSTNEVSIAAQADVNGLEIHATPGGRISGHVLDAKGNAVAGGTVVLYDGEDISVAAAEVSDEFGFYEFKGLADGVWTVRVQSQGLWCSAVSTNLVLSGTVRELEADFELELGARVSGTVTFGGSPATNGTVQAITEDGVSYECPVEADGTWSLDGLPAGTYDIRHYSLEAFSPDSTVTLVVGDDVTLDLNSTVRPLFFPTRSVGFGSLETSFLYLDPERAAAASAWEWDFDSDGVVDSTEAQPTWTYSKLGTNTVTLVMTEADGTRTISVYADCVRVEEEIETILKAGAILFGTNSGTLEVFEKSEGRLVLAGEPETGTLSAGMVLMGQCNEEWFCRRVLSATKEDGNWVLATEYADWSDIYQQVGMSVFVPIDLGEEEDATEFALRASPGRRELIREEGLRAGMNVMPGGGFEVVQTIIDGRKYEYWKLKLSLTMEVWYTLEGKVGYRKNLEQEIKAPSLSLPAGFSLSGKASVYANGQAYLRGTISQATVGATGSIVIGRETWEGEKGHWFPPGEFEPIYSSPDGEVEGHAGIEFGLSFGPTIHFLETASVQLMVNPYAKLDITASTKAPVNLDLHVGASLHAALNLIDWSVGWFKVKVGVEGDVANIGKSLIKMTGPEPDFTWSPRTAPDVPGRFDFSNQSKGAHFVGPKSDFYVPNQRYDWDFGDGSDSADVNPSHTYSQEGSYTASLKAYGGFIAGPYRKKATLHVGKPEDIPEDDKPDYMMDDNKSKKSQQSLDPNEMRGPTGVGEERVVERGQWMDYTVFFENHAGEDVADAQEVMVTLSLDPALDWSTFKAGEVSFGDYTDLGLEGLVRGRSTVALTNGAGRSVKTTLEYDEESGVAKWYLRIVDAKGMFGWPEDGAGFLPPNDVATHCGEGYLTYRVKVRDDAPDGARIDAAAAIVFDYNAPIATDPLWWNKVGVPPETVQVTLDGDDWTEVVVGQPYGNALPTPERLGWSFEGWFTGPNGTGTEVTPETIASADTLELFAKWTRAVFVELWLDVSHGSVFLGTNGVTSGFAPDGSAVEGIAERYVLTGTSTVHGVKFAGGEFTTSWTNLVVDVEEKDKEGMALEGAQVEVTLEGENFVGSGEDCAGIRVDEESGLVLDGPGRLVAQGGAYGAGIGGGLEQKNGRIEIRGGTVEARGGDFGAGIGGGLVGPGAEVVVTGGSVKARGQKGADIGSGYGEAAGGAPTDGNGAAVHEVEVPFATDALPVVVAVDLGEGRTYQYEGMGHEGDSSLWFWLPDGTYDFETDGDDYGAHVAGTKVAAVFTDPGAEHFEAPAAELVEASAEGWRVGLNPAYRTTPFELWTATGLKDGDWDWVKVEPSSYRVDAETGAVEWTGAQSEGLRVFKFHFLPKK